MLTWLRLSLSARAGLAVLLITVLALSSAISAGLLAWVSEDDAHAINSAGSLRMAAYRLSWRLQAQAPAAEIRALMTDMERRLHSPVLHQEHGAGSADMALRQSYQQLLRSWEQELRPVLLAGDLRLLPARSEAFVARADHFVLLLQRQSEKRQSLQQYIQGAALIVTVFILLVGMYELQSSVLSPLQELVAATERFRAGDWRARIAYRADDELGLMAESFNAMADAIEDSHRTLESRVQEKTRSLAQSNAALELLYQSSQHLASHPATVGQLDELIERFQQHLPGLRLTLCLHGSASEPADHLIALHGSAAREICARNDCNSCERKHAIAQKSFSISSQGKSLGELRARYLGGRGPRDWEMELIQALANLIGTSLSLERQREQDNRLLLLDERTTIARELHDSLAQALSYMKLQVSRLQTLIRRGDSAEQLDSVSEELREGLNNAYRQLRELLTTFRLQIHDGGLEQALDDAAQEFAARGGFRVLLHCAALPFELTATEQIHVLQIAREALSNCARHSGASQVWVQLRQQDEQVELSVEDDGCGITPAYDQRQHHGLTIMQERARSLQGRLVLEPRQAGGTRLQLNFKPGFLQQTSYKEMA